jgi:hypothetical protein
MNICLGCGKETKDGQELNGLLKCHWDCTDATRDKLGEAVADELIQQRINLRLLQDGLSPAHPLWKKLGGSL